MNTSSGRCGMWIVVCLFCGILAGAGTALAQPFNDDCADAIPITDGTRTGSTVGATNDGSGTCGASSSSPDVWYVYTAHVDGFLNVELCGSTYDTVLGIWNGCPGGGSELACNDDACGLQSMVSAPINEDGVYYIRVSGYSGATGSYTLDVEGAEGGGTGGPDVVYQDFSSIAEYGPVGDIRAYVLSTSTCNIGDENLLWGFNHDGTPAVGWNLYRLDQGRLEQIGMSWVKNACCAAAGSGCGLPCNGQGGSVLGVGCRDVYGTGWNAQQGYLGARSGFNAFTGYCPGPPGGSGNSIFRRLQVHEADLDSPTARYFAGGTYVASDDAAAGNALNNASYKRATLGANYNLSPEGSMYIGTPAIYAWHDHGNGTNQPDESVDVFIVDVPDEGRFHMASKVTDMGGGRFEYAYAIFNLNSHRSGGSFTVPVPPGADVSNVGFHDVDYHSGEVYDNTDWITTIEATGVTWSSPRPHSEDPDSNALRWGTMYTFWFEADVEPGTGEVTLGLFRPGLPASVTATTSVPGGCPGDCLADGQLNGNDIRGFVDCLLGAGSNCSCADVDGNGTVNMDDIAPFAALLVSGQGCL